MKMFSNIKFLLVIFLLCLIFTNSSFLKKSDNEIKANLEAEAETQGCIKSGNSCTNGKKECCGSKQNSVACVKKIKNGKYYC
jgi:hypothetical protein